MTDSSSTVVWAADYKPFGEATVTISTITNNLRFPGQYYDQETGLLYNLNRDYSSLIGRYIEADPVGIGEGDNHLYIYVNNNSPNSTDPSGLWAQWIHRKITRNALARVNCSKAADKIIAYNLANDNRVGQQPENAYWHAMSNGKRNQPNKEVDEAGWAKRVGAGATSCKEQVIGDATHAMQDYFAPAHRGFQPWRNHWWEYPKHWADNFEGPASASAELATEKLLRGIAERCPCLCK